MKFSFCFSSSHSSPTSPSDGNLQATSRIRKTKSRCILRRLLCGGSLPTHPCDQIKESSQCEEEEELLQHQDSSEVDKIEAPPPPPPGIVARLMGLESTPELNCIPPGKPLNSIGRSRSLNAAEFSSKFDKRKHRMVGKSVSFRDPPTFILLETADFFLLSFENVAEKFKDLGSKGGKKSDMGSEHLKQRKVETNEKESKTETVLAKNNKNKQNKKQDKKNDDRKQRRRISDPCLASPGNNIDVYRKFPNLAKTTSPPKHKQYKELLTAPKKQHRLPPLMKFESESDSENSSPVSVLDVGDFLIDTRTPLPEKEVKPGGSRGIDVELWRWICKLAKDEVVHSSKISRKIPKQEEVAEIGTEFGLHIVDQLLNEIIYELHDCSAHEEIESSCSSASVSSHSIVVCEYITSGPQQMYLLPNNWEPTSIGVSECQI